MPPKESTTSERRVLFDFEIEFANGGGVKGEGFRLDIQGEGISDDELADYVVRDMRLFLTEDVATYLVRCGAALVGIDSLNIDDTANGRRPVHTTLLAAGIPIVEHLTGLDRLPATGFLFFTVPVKVRGCGTFPARAFAVLGR
jgi:kynurenine formamidase